GQCKPCIIDETIFYQFIGIPSVSKLFTYCYWYGGHLPYIFINLRILGPDDIFNKIRFQLFKGLAYFDTIGQVKSRVQVNGPVAHSPYGLINPSTVVDGLVYIFIKIKWLVTIPSGRTDSIRP